MSLLFIIPYWAGRFPNLAAHPGRLIGRLDSWRWFNWKIKIPVSMQAETSYCGRRCGWIGSPWGCVSSDVRRTSGAGQVTSSFVKFAFDQQVSSPSIRQTSISADLPAKLHNRWPAGAPVWRHLRCTVIWSGLSCSSAAELAVASLRWMNRPTISRRSPELPTLRGGVMALPERGFTHTDGDPVTAVSCESGRIWSDFSWQDQCTPIRRLFNEGHRAATTRTAKMPYAGPAFAGVYDAVRRYGAFSAKWTSIHRGWFRT